MARDLTTGNKTNPVPRKENPDYNKDDGSPKFIPDEPHIGLHVEDDQAKPLTVQTGIVRGGTTNPAKGQSGDVERIAFTEVKGDYVHGDGVAAVSTSDDKDGRTKVDPNDESLPTDDVDAPKTPADKGGKKS